MKRVVSGIQPTGKLHLGNLVGAVENWVKIQTQYDCFFFIADLHALTTCYADPSSLKDDIRGIVLDLLSAGLDPEQVVFFRQSDLPQHAELHVLLSMITPLSWLERVPTYKSKIDEMGNKELDSYGFLGYPVLQAADILLYKADFVPVGRDQLPHIELTREIARRFNIFYGALFSIPQDLLTAFPVLPGTDGRKMSKSYQNTIALADAPEMVREKVAQMVTDPARIKKDDPGHPEICSVYAFYRVFGKPVVATVENECRAGKRGCVGCKKELTGLLVDYLAPMHARRRKLEDKSGLVEETLSAGMKKALPVANQNLQAVKKAMGLLC